MMQSMLLDFYGELLTERQRSCYDLHVNEDLSLSEIAEQAGVSRQGVWDNIRRAEAALQEMEAKTGLIRRFRDTRRGLEALRELLGELRGETEGRARELADQAADAVERLLD